MKPIDEMPDDPGENFNAKDIPLGDLDRMEIANLDDFPDTGQLSDADNRMLMETEAEGRADTDATVLKKRVFIDTPITATRRTNIQRFRESSNMSKGDLLHALGISATKGAHMYGPTPQQHIDDEFAQLFESTFNLPVGYLDKPVDGLVLASGKPVTKREPYKQKIDAATGIDAKILEASFAKVLEASKGKPAGARAIAKLTTLTYCDAQDNDGQIRDSVVARFVDVLLN